jgi:hypothetical protein
MSHGKGNGRGNRKWLSKPAYPEVSTKTRRPSMEKAVTGVSRQFSVFSVAPCEPIFLSRRHREH